MEKECVTLMANGVCMKAIQITIDEDLLSELDGDPTVKTDGRSAVLRRAITEYLANARAAEISRSYSDGYAATKGWTKEESDWLDDDGEWAAE